MSTIELDAFLADSVASVQGKLYALGAGPKGPVNRIAGEFTAGGSEEQIVPIALNLNGLALPGPGDYRVVISMQGQDVKTLGFTVQALAAQPRQPPLPPTTGTAGYL